MLKKIFISILFFCALFTVNLDAQWNRTNPGAGGWMMSAGAGPTGTIVVGSDLSGAYISKDDGASWDALGFASGLTTTHVGTAGFDPIDGDIFYLGTNNGIYRTNDGGNSVSHVFDPEGPASAILDIKISKSNTDIGYATYHSQWNGLDGIVYKTIDQGISWFPISQNLASNLRLLKIIIHPDNPDILFVLSGKDRFACGEAKVYRSINGGVNWTALASDISDSIQIMDIAIDPNIPEIMYLTTMDVTCGSPLTYGGDLYKSIDSGETWFDPNPNVNKRSGIIFLDENEPSVVRLIDVRKTAPWISTSGTFTSIDGGVNWTQTGEETDWESGYLETFNDDEGTVIHRSFGNNGNYNSTLGTNLSDPSKIYWVNTRFVYGSDDSGTVFRNLFTKQDSMGLWQSTGVDNVVLYDIEISEVNPNVIYAGFGDNGLWRSLNAGLSWESCNTAEYTEIWNGFGGNSYTIAPDPGREEVVWAVLSGNQKCYLVRSNSYGHIDSWTESNNGLPISNEITDIAVDPNSDIQSRTLFSVVSKDVYKSTDDGLNWSLSFDVGAVWFVEVDPDDSNIIYAGGSGGFYRSEDAGNSWSESGLMEMGDVNNTARFYQKSYRGVSSIHSSRCEPGIVYLTAYGEGKGLYRSLDYGATWEKMFEAPHLRTVAVSENNHKVIMTGSSFVGASGGIADSTMISFKASLDGGETWFVDDANLAYPSIVDLELNHSNPEKVFALSQGTGIQWAYDLVVPYRYFEDADGDSFGNTESSMTSCFSIPPDGYVSNDLDCDDTNEAINPDASEICSQSDENCDGFINEGLALFTYFLDSDGDSFGDAESAIDTCADSLTDGFSQNDLDCDDSNQNIYPGAEEIPNNGIDEDCDGEDLIVGIIEFSGKEVKLYPNPTKDFIFIEKPTELLLRYQLHSHEGILLIDYGNVDQLDLQFLSSGLYLLKVIDISTGKSAIERIVKL